MTSWAELMQRSCPEQEETAAEVHHPWMAMDMEETAEEVVGAGQQAGSRYQHQSWRRTPSAGTEARGSNTVQYAIYSIYM